MTLIPNAFELRPLALSEVLYPCYTLNEYHIPLQALKNLLNNTLRWSLLACPPFRPIDSNRRDEICRA